jgi:hypothetical protein
MDRSNLGTMRIRRGLGSRRLPCGCVAGVYETYRDEVVTIVDAAAPRCADPAHQAGNVIPAATDQPHPSEAQEIPRH